MESLPIRACHTPVVSRVSSARVPKIVAIDHTVAAVTPTEISVSIEAVRCRALRNAMRWNGQAAHVTIGSASAMSTHCHPVKRVSGKTANITDRWASGTNSTAAAARRSISDRATASSGSGRSSVSRLRGSAS